MYNNTFVSPKLLPALLLCFAFACHKEDTTPPAEIKYFPKVKVIIEQNCISCHSSADPLNWPGIPLAFDTDQDISMYSRFIRMAVDLATPTDKRMPKSGSLTTKQIDDIVKWCEKGGKVTD